MGWAGSARLDYRWMDLEAVRGGLMFVLGVVSILIFGKGHMCRALVSYVRYCGLVYCTMVHGLMLCITEVEVMSVALGVGTSGKVKKIVETNNTIRSYITIKNIDLI